MRPGEDAGGQHGRSEARAFLVRPVRHDDRVLGLDSEIVERPHDFETAQHAEHAIVFPARRLRVEMRAHINRQRVGIGALAPGEHVAHRIKAHRAARRLAPGLEQRAALRVVIGQRLAVVAACDTRADLRHLHDAVPETVAIDPEVLARCCHVTSLLSRAGALLDRGGICFYHLVKARLQCPRSCQVHPGRKDRID